MILFLGDFSLDATAEREPVLPWHALLSTEAIIPEGLALKKVSACHRATQASLKFDRFFPPTYNGLSRS
jgi:hypothetical protein